MLVNNFVAKHPAMGQTKTYEDFANFIGTQPHRMGIVSRMYKHLTSSFLTEGLGNVYYNDTVKSTKFQSINSLYFEWEIDVNFIKRVELAADPIGDGTNGSDIVFAFKEPYYQKYDTFKVELTKQQFLVKSAPIRKSNGYYEVIAQLVDNDYSGVLDTDLTKEGASTRWLSNAHPELSEEGFTKYQSNVERHRNWITTYRNDISFSALHAAMEDTFIKIATGDPKADNKETTFKMKKKEKELLDNFMEARNNGLLFSKTNVGANGKPTSFDPSTGRPIYIGEGVIPQIQRYAQKYSYAKVTTNMFDSIMSTMAQRAAEPTGNTFAFVVNQKLYDQIQSSLREYLFNFKTNGAWLYSAAAKGKVSVGTTFSSYEFGGNQFTFHIDKALTYEYPNSGYGICVDLTSDKADGTPAVQLFTIKGGEFIRGVLNGVGQLDGTSSGIINTAVAGGKLVHMGYAGIGVFNPYRSVEIIES